MTNYNQLIKVRLWYNDDSVDLTIRRDEYSILIQWASRNNIQVYTLN